MSDEYLLSMTGVSKRFPGVMALKDVHLKVKRGTVHGVMGENGAGKSTLMKILMGIYVPDEGSITFKGAPLRIASTHDALSKGISMIHQELNPIPQMTVAENIFLGRETRTWYGLVNMRKMRRDTTELLDRLGVQVDADRKMVDLSIANTQLVEIAKAISYESDLIVMDEPTSAITEAEVANLMKTIRSLRDRGISVIYITHKMDEVFKICDEVTVLRDGQFISTDPIATLNHDLLISKMVGRELGNVFYRESVAADEVVLDVKNLTGRRFRNVSFSLHKGEILGIAGLMGAGRTELLEGVFGVEPSHGDGIWVHGKKVDIRQPLDAIRHGLAFLTEDRKLTGLYLNASVRDNMFLANIRSYVRGLFLNFRKINQDCEKMKDTIRIKTPNLQQVIKNLSGGNQQKVLIARWLLTKPDILILDEPTRGIDVGAKAEIYNLMHELVKEGKSIIMISSELPEILGMSDRILVMHEGDKVGEISRKDADQEKILLMATGIPLANLSA